MSTISSSINSFEYLALGDIICKVTAATKREIKRKYAGGRNNHEGIKIILKDKAERIKIMNAGVSNKLL